MAASLAKQNPWLRDPKGRDEALRVSAASSSAVESIRKPFLTLPVVGQSPAAPRKSAKSGG